MSTSSTSQIPGGSERMFNMPLSRIGAAYPRIFFTIRYKLDPKTGLFIFKKEEDIRCYFSPFANESTTGFDISHNNLWKDISSDLKTFYFKVYFNVDLIDAKISVGYQDNKVDFTAPHNRPLIGISGSFDNKGNCHTKSWKV